MEAIFQDPTFQEQPLEVKKKVINNYFQKEIASDPSFQEQPEEIKQKVYQNFLKENLGETTPEIDKDKVIIDTAKSDENIKQLVINKAETSVLDQMGTKITRPFNEEEQKQVDEFWGKIQMTPEKEQQYREQLQSPEKAYLASKEYFEQPDPDAIKAEAERFTFEYSQLLDLGKAYWQQFWNGKIDPELEAKLIKQRQKTLEAMAEAFARRGYDLKLVEEGDESYLVAEKDGKQYRLDENFIKSFVQNMKASKYEISSGAAGGIAGAKIGAQIGTKLWGIQGAAIGGTIGMFLGSALGVFGGSMADYGVAAETVGEKPSKEQYISQGLQAASADLLAGLFLKGVEKLVKTAVVPFKIVGKKIYLAYEKPAYRQLLKDTGITDDIAEKYFNEFISYYNINPKKLSQTEKLKLKMLAVALKSPKHKKDILSAIASNTDASLVVSDDINIRAQKLMDFLKKGYTPTEVKQAIKAQKTQVMKKYADMEHTLKEALKNQPVKIEQLQIDDILNRAYMTAGDDTIKQKFKGLKAQIKDLFDRNGYNAATLMEVRKQINDFYSKNYKAIDYAPTKQAIRGLKDQIDNLLDQAIERTGIPELKQMKDKVIKEYAKVSKAEGTTLYKKLFKQGVSSDEANRALAKGLMAEDDDAIKFLNALPPADREKTELGAINAIVKDNRIIIGGKHEAQAIDWDKLSHQLEKIQKNVKSPAAKKTIKAINKMSEMFNKDPEMQSIASAVAAKIPDTIAQRLWGKITQSFNKLRFELMLRWFPSSLIPDTKLLDLYKAKSYVRRLRYIDLISSAMEKPKSFKGFVLELTKFPDKKISSQAKKLLNAIKIAEKRFYHYSTKKLDEVKPSAKPSAYSEEGRRAAEGANIPKAWFYEEGADVEKYFNQVPYEHKAELKGLKLMNLGDKEEVSKLKTYVNEHWDEYIQKWKELNPKKPIPNGIEKWIQEQALKDLGYDGAYDPVRKTAFTFKPVKVKPLEIQYAKKAGENWQKVEKGAPAQISFETIPSSTKDPELFNLLNNADWKTKVEFDKDLNKLLFNKKGELIPAKILGYKATYGDKVKVGSYMGHLNPSRQVVMKVKQDIVDGVPLISKKDKKKIELIGRAINDILNQDAVGYHKVTPLRNVANGIFVKVDKIGYNEIKELSDILKKHFGKPIDLIDSPHGVRIVDWDAWDVLETKKTPVEFLRKAKAAVKEWAEKTGKRIKIQPFYADSNLIEGGLDDIAGLYKGTEERGSLRGGTAGRASKRGRGNSEIDALKAYVKAAKKAAEKKRAKWKEKLVNTEFNTAFQKETEISIPDDIKVAHYEGLAKQAGYRPEDIINDELSRPTNAKGVRNAVKRYLKGNPTERDKEIIDAIIRAVDGSGIWTHPATIGALYGFEQDENGNWQYNPVKGVMGAFGASLAKKVLTDKQMMNAIKMFAKKEGAKLHDKLLKSPFSPVKFAVEAGTKTREPFYLKSVKVLNKVANQKMTREQLINYLKKNGVKDEEVEWVIKPLIKGKTKIAISDILENAKPPKIDIKKRTTTTYDKWSTKLGRYEENLAIYKHPKTGDFKTQHFNDKNVLYHYRTTKRMSTDPLNKKLNEKIKEFVNKYHIYNLDVNVDDLPIEARKDFREIKKIKEQLNKKKERLKDIIIEEIQSDWHKEGAKYGYKKPRVNAKKAISYAFTNILPDKQKRILREILKDKKKEIKLIKKIETKLCKAIGGDKNKARRKLFDALYARNFKELGISDKYKDDFNTMLAIKDFENVELNWHTPSVKVVFKRYPKGEKFVKSGGFDKLIDVLNIKKEKVPNAPFKKTWHEKALKDILEEAAQSDADAIYWTSGKVQSERYNLKTYLDKLKVKKTDKGIVIDAIDKEGKEHIINVAEDKELSDYLGKDMAEKVKEGLKTQKEVVFEGEQLSMNPKGFFDLYDKKIPQFLKKYLKKYKVEPKRVKIQGYEMWKLPLTKELKKDIIEKGQPFFIVPIILTGAAIKENE